MLAWFNSRSADTSKATDLYGAVVAQARNPAFYAECGIEDTPEGRYELIVLHIALVLERLSAAGDEGKALSRGLVEAFVQDMDDSLREMGVGDLSVPTKVKQAAGGLYDRTAEYGAALRDTGADVLRGRLDENLPGVKSAGRGEALAQYVRTAARQLAGWETRRLISGHVEFPHIAIGDSSGATP